MGLWEDLGFRANPFDTKALTPGSADRRLLVGRDSELDELRRRIEARSGQSVSLEGMTGVGKTTLVQVLAGQLVESDEPVFLSLRRPLSLSDDSVPGEFRLDAVIQLAEAAVDARRRLVDAGASSATAKALDVLEGQLPRRGEPHALVVLAPAVEDAYTALAADPVFGSALCLVDNVEILAMSDSAKAALGQARDQILTLPGTQWIFAGTPGSVRGVLSEPRMTGFVTEPMIVRPLSAQQAADVVQRRYEQFRTRPDAVEPVSPEGFLWLYTVLGDELRSALNTAGDFARQSAQGLPADGPTALRAELAEFVLASGRSYVENNTGRFEGWVWDVLDQLGMLADRLVPLDRHGDVGCDTMPRFAQAAEALAECQLVAKVNYDETTLSYDVALTPQGRLALHYRAEMRQRGATA